MAPAQKGLLGRLRRGIEKEGLRVDAEGSIVQTAHPHGLGSKLTHPHITTDYSEALLEYITPVYCRPADALSFLGDLVRFTYRQLDGEWIWPASMPARLQGNDSIPIADYGTSNIGTMKHVYRKGLDARYGRIMQSIAGIHYNVSLPDDIWPLLQKLEGRQDESLQGYRSTRYFDLIRNGSEQNFLRFVPAEQRQALYNQWYQGHAQLKDAIAYTDFDHTTPTALTYSKTDLETNRSVLQRFAAQLGERAGAVAGTPDTLNRCAHNNCQR
ncbi:fatty acid cis/trans isomerase, partial [Salinicola salarius]|uniref:fatty acid cis/trans isomerase n=1 Tax=Salinicola salarius TaxID=430457 RepID=UPI0026EF9B1A